MDFFLRDETFEILGAAMEVHNSLGAGFLEAVYQEAMEIEFTERGIPFVSQKPLAICYKGRHLKKTYAADLFCHGQIIVELKALDRLSSKEEAQLLNYIKATGVRIGLLVNFGVSNKLEWKRMVK